MEDMEDIVARNNLKLQFPAKGHVEDFDRMFEIDQLITALGQEREALSYHTKERLEHMTEGEIVISKADPNRIYQVERYGIHATTYTVRTVIQPGIRSNNRSRDL